MMSAVWDINFQWNCAKHSDDRQIMKKKWTLREEKRKNNEKIAIQKTLKS